MSSVAAKNVVLQFLNDHRDSAYEDSLLLDVILNPLLCAIGDLSRNLELNSVQFKIRGGLQGFCEVKLLLKDPADKLLQKNCFC